ncbi:hypothetical protein BJX64DRAFT_163069 [Aspergillus heterothallicus]
MSRQCNHELSRLLYLLTTSLASFRSRLWLCRRINAIHVTTWPCCVSSAGSLCADLSGPLCIVGFSLSTASFMLVQARGAPSLASERQGLRMHRQTIEELVNSLV